VPPIIDADTFEAAQQALRNHQRLASRNRKHEYLLFGGRLRCGRCGRGMFSLCRDRNIRYYLCNSQHQLMDRTLRCPGSLRADVVEPEVWGAVMRVLEHPELIAAEVARQEARADEQRAEIAGHIALIEAALAKCDREAQRWADAYAGEAINLAELKGYRAEIATRRQSLQAEHAACQRQLEAIGAAVQQVDALTAHCARVRQRLQTFDQAEKRIAIEALDIRVSWIPGQPLVIHGSIPLGQIAAIPSSGQFHQPLRPKLLQGGVKGALVDSVGLEKLHAQLDDHGFLNRHRWQRLAVPQRVKQGIAQACLSAQSDMGVPDIRTIFGASRSQDRQLAHLLGQAGLVAHVIE
jgi:Recombinase zinc beta ribbon domain